jgi:hypothetical protein
MRSQMQSLVTLILFGEETRITQVTEAVSEFTQIKKAIQGGNVKAHENFTTEFDGMDVSAEIEIYKKKLVFLFCLM